MMDNIRFKDDEGNEYPRWKNVAFSETYLKAKEGGTPSTAKSDYYGNGIIPFVKIDDLKNKYIFQVSTYINELGLKNSSAWVVPIGSVLLSNGATIGETSINKIEIATKQGILGIIPKIYNEFLYYLVSSNSFRKELKRITTKGTMDAAYIKDIARIKVNVPSDLEQEKIGGFLSSFDGLIQKQQEKIGLLKELKKGYLQQMFPVKGSNIPKIRFKGFTEAWEQRNVSEITSFHKQGYYTTESYSDTKKYYLLRGTDFSQNSLILKDTPKIDASEKDYQAFKVEIGDFLIVRSGTVGTYGIVYDDIPAIFGSYLINFRFDQSIVMNEFFGLFYQSHLFRSQLSKIIQQSANTNINAENIKSTSIQLPLLQEQRKISIFLESIDKLITLHQHKLEKLEEMKKGYMQRLFI